MNTDDRDLLIGILVVISVVALGLYFIPWFTLGAVLGIAGTVTLLVSKIS